MASKTKKRSVSTNVTPVVEKTAAVKPSAVRTMGAEFNPDYTYVKQDLKRIGILAGSFITILVVLSFFLR